MPTPQSTLTARPERHTYSSGHAFYLVRCDVCMVVLNSAHHYDEVNGAPCPHAVAIADRHNKAEHTYLEQYAPAWVAEVLTLAAAL